MNKEENRKFIKKTESLIHPQDVTAISFLGDFNKYLPLKLQNKIMQKGSRKIPYMGFVVDPYCFFLSYEIKNREAAQAMLPEGYELVDTSIFENEEKKPLVIMSAFTARTSAFTGFRFECYIIARSRKTGLVSWIIADYETNTNSHDPGKGFCGYSCDPAVFATTPYGELLVDVQDRVEQKRFSVNVDLATKPFQKLNETLWIEGNMSVDYGGSMRSSAAAPFSLIFDPVLMKEAIPVPLDNVQIFSNTFMEDVINGNEPESAAIFPYSQHFIIKQDLSEQEIQRTEDLYVHIEHFMERKKFKIMSGDDIKKPLFRGMILSSLINLGIIIFLLFKCFNG